MLSAVPPPPLPAPSFNLCKVTNYESKGDKTLVMNYVTYKCGQVNRCDGRCLAVSNLMVTLPADDSSMETAASAVPCSLGGSCFHCSEECAWKRAGFRVHHCSRLHMLNVGQSPPPPSSSVPRENTGWTHLLVVSRNGAPGQRNPGALFYWVLVDTYEMSLRSLTGLRFA